MQNTLVVLVHGFFKGPRDMAFLAAGLREAGYPVLQVKLPTTFGSLDDCVEALHHLHHSVFIATPHAGSRLAEIASRVPGYRQIFKSVNALLCNRSCPLKPDPLGKLGVIAGSRNQGLGGLWLSAQSDGRVELASTHADDVDELVTLPFGHKAIHQQRARLSEVLSFLARGRFGC